MVVGGGVPEDGRFRFCWLRSNLSACRVRFALPASAEAADRPNWLALDGGYASGGARHSVRNNYVCVVPVNVRIPVMHVYIGIPICTVGTARRRSVVSNVS